MRVFLKGADWTGLHGIFCFEPERVDLDLSVTIRFLLDPVRIPNTAMVSEENLPAAIAILRFNGIEVEVEK